MTEEAEHGLGFYVKVIRNQLDMRCNSVLKNYGITFPQLEVLRYIYCMQKKDQTAKQKDLEEFFHVSNPTISAMLDRLETKNMIQRIPDPGDRRIRKLICTQEGLDLLNEMARQIRDIEQQCTFNMAEDEKNAGKAFLKKVVRNLFSEEKQNVC